MPSKNGFGNKRTPLNKKVQYGVDQKNPVMFKSPLKLDGPTDVIREGEFGTGRKIPKKNTYQ